MRALGFDDNFLRTWDYYLAYCEGAFRERHIGNVQLTLTKCTNSLPLYGEPWGDANIADRAELERPALVGA